MGQENPVPRRINKGEGAVNQVMKSGGLGVTEFWGLVDYGLAFEGIVTSVAGAPAFNCENLIGFGNGFFQDYWSYVVWDSAGGGAAPQGQMLQCTGYTSGTGLFTVAAYAPVIAVGDHVLLLHPSIAEILAIHTELATVDGIVDNIILDSVVRSITSDGKVITFGAGNAKYLQIDSGTNGAEILAIILNNYVGKDWTVDTYVPYVDGVGAPAAIDQRDTFSIINTDAAGGLLKPTGIAFNMFLDFTNDAGAGNETMTVTVVYRSREVLSLAWEA